MKVPPGFKVEVVASEPDLVNPIAIAFDERGRAWVTESLEYPRSEPGVGKDRIKILEDTNGDGRMDKVTIFAEGLNIPSGLAVGYGGAWVGNAPDLLFLADTDGDDKADKKEVVVTGFGRDDTHELPNAFTWGPDGWLYGLNGVFNYCHVKYPKESARFRADHPGWKFTVAMFRVNPRTREFQVFAEGTSNPWGIAFDHEGSAFVSACVIDHLWHIVENGYYHRQAGAYPPFTWKIESIVKHKHQKAAYCGITYYDSDVYPPQFRNTLYMGNIHGGCVNADKLERRQSTYFGTGEPDFLTANDAWFMPVAQLTGPDGCLYVLDWYDQYHCYQDARRDPAGIERGKGRLYRIRYQDSPRAPRLDLGQETDEQLIERLASGNGYLRETARRLLAERGTVETAAALQKLVVAEATSFQARRQGLFCLMSMAAERVPEEFIASLLDNKQFSLLRAWGIRWLASRNRAAVFAQADRLQRLIRDPAADVRLQLAIAAGRLPADSPVALDVLLALTSTVDDQDPLLPRMIWKGLEPRLEQQSAGLAKQLAEANPQAKELHAALTKTGILPRLADRLLAAKPIPVASVAAVLARSLERESAPTTGVSLMQLITQKLQTAEIPAAAVPELRAVLSPVLQKVLAGAPDQPAVFAAAMLSTSWKAPEGIAAARGIVTSRTAAPANRQAAFSALITARDEQILKLTADVLADRERLSTDVRGQMLAALGQLDDPAVAHVVLTGYATTEPVLQAKIVELLTGRVAWGKALMGAIGEKQLPASALNVNQVRKLHALKDAELSKLVTDRWGQVREGRNPAREQVIAKMRRHLRKNPGDPHQGQQVYKKLCGQCHKIYGEGFEVGPDITLNGRSSFEQLLSNVFDPNLVIGADYQARIVLTTDGRVISGLIVEDSPQRVVLKVQGGKQEIIPRDKVEEFSVSKLSLMPEDVEKQLQPEEWSNLFAFLTLDKPPSDPMARRLPGSRDVQPRETTNPAQFNDIVAEVAPDFTLGAAGEGGVALLAEHFGRPGVVRTHPLDRGVPCILKRSVSIPEGKKARLIVDVSHHPQGNWQLIIKGNGDLLHQGLIAADTTTDHWQEVTVDLSRFAGKSVTLELLNHPNDWSNEFAYWGRADVIIE